VNVLDKIYAIINAYLALVCYPFFKPKKPLWLIGGHNAKLYTDNAKVFYEYILQEHQNIDICWVIDKDAPAFEHIQGKKVIKGSLQSYLYFYHARVVLFSDTLNSDIAPFSFLLPFVRHFYDKTYKVYLGHGTIAFKKMPSFTGRLAQLKKDVFYSYDLAIASTTLAQKAMIGYNINPSAIVLCGSARHDALESTEHNKNTILLTPTWRPWLQGIKDFDSSDFFHQYALLLSHKKLLTYLKAQGISLQFYLHHMLHEHWEAFKVYENDQVHVLPPHTAIDESIKSAKLMLTDYSSTCSDFYYLQKPVLFFQFDQKRFSEDVGSEISLKNDTFGEVAFDVDTFVTHIINTIENGYTLSKKQKEGEKYFIHFKDNQNCRRIYDTICQRNPKTLLCTP